jgi:hypothetical protein
MSEPEVPFYVIGALVILYIAAATWQSKDAACRPVEQLQRPLERSPTVDRRVVHWWRARRRRKSPRATR